MLWDLTFDTNAVTLWVDLGRMDFGGFVVFWGSPAPFATVCFLYQWIEHSSLFEHSVYAPAGSCKYFTLGLFFSDLQRLGFLQKWVGFVVVSCQPAPTSKANQMV